MKRRTWTLAFDCLLLPTITGGPLLGLATPAAATTSDQLSSLEYSAPEGCPTEAAFEQLVLARGVTLDDSAPGDSTQGHNVRVSVSIDRRGDGFVGTLDVNDAEGAVEPREVVSSSCSEVADALAVVTAIAARERATPTTAAQKPVPSPSPPRPAEVGHGTSTTREPEAQHFRHVAGSAPQWIRPGELHHETRVPAGTLSLDSKLAIDTHAGATFGLLPGLVVPRYDLSARSVIFLSTPGEDPFLLGVVPRIRLSFLGPATVSTGSISSELLGMQFAMGSCLTPYYDDRGLVLLGCIEYGGNAIELRSTNGAERWEQPAGSGVVAVTVEAEYNVSSWAHFGLRAGWEARIQGDHVIEDPDGAALFRLGGNSAFVSLGFGVHF